MYDCVFLFYGYCSDPLCLREKGEKEFEIKTFRNLKKAFKNSRELSSLPPTTPPADCQRLQPQQSGEASEGQEYFKMADSSH